MDTAMLMRMARFAIENNFGKTRTRRIRLDFDVHDHVHRLSRHHLPLVPNLTGNHRLGLDVSGPGGGQWKLVLRDGRLVETEVGLNRQCSAVFQLDALTFRALGARELAAVEAVRSGRVAIQGNGLEPAQLAAILQAAAERGAVGVGEPS